VEYLTVAAAYRDLEQASGRLALVDRLAVLLAGTPDGLLPVVCYLCQGLIAPEFAGVDLGLAEKLAVRAVATATGASPAEVTALVGPRPGGAAAPPSRAGCRFQLRPGPRRRPESR
jgi:DNA ligase-1